MKLENGASTVACPALPGRLAASHRKQPGPKVARTQVRLRSGLRWAHLAGTGCCLAAVLALLPFTANAQVITNSSFEGDSLAGWTVGGTGRVGTIQNTHVTNGGVPGGVPDGTWYAVLSSGAGAVGGPTAQIDGNTTLEYDIATLQITVTIPFWPAVLEFDWTFPSSEQDQPGQYDDLFDVMIYQGAPPADPTINNRVFARSAPRNVPQDFSNFTNAHFRGTAPFQQTINRPGSPVHNTSLSWGVAEFRRACVGIDLPEFPGPPYTRTIRFRVADQADQQFDSALFLDRVQVLPSCDPATQMAISQRTNTVGSDLQIKDGGLVHRPVLTRRLAIDPTGRVMAVASNANLDGTNPSFVEQVFIQVDEGGWQRVSGLPINEGGEVQSLAFSATSDATPGRYLAIAARVSENDNFEIYRWDRQGAGSLTTVTNTSGCENVNPSISNAGGVIAFESTCNAITGAGSVRKLNIWSGGAANSGNAFLPGGACVGRAPALSSNSGQDGQYLAFESNCNPTGGNTDGNFEIFRYRNSGGAGTRYAQITNTSGAVVNALPQMDRASNGANVYFLSNVNDTARGLHVFRYACSNANCTGGTRTQWTDGPATVTYFGFRKLHRPVATDNAVIDDFVFERLVSGTFEVGHRIGPTGVETSITLPQPLLGLAGGLDGTSPVIGFLSRLDILPGQNADTNSEAFTARVQP